MADKEASKTEVQKGEEKQAEAVDKVNTKSADVLTAAAASGDAAVHNLLGERVIAEQNQDTEALKEIDKKLADSSASTERSPRLITSGKGAQVLSVWAPAYREEV